MRTASAIAAAAFASLAGCGEEAPPRPPEEKRESRASVPSTVPTTPRAARQAATSAESDDAATVLRRYYAMIEDRHYAEAHALREPGATDAAAFAAHFASFESHRATVGAPSEPAEADGWRYVEVPVQTYGAMKDGSPFGSAGTVTLRRPKSGGPWRIFTNR